MQLTVDAYRDAEAAYADGWERIDDWLRQLCAASGHSSRREVHAKIAIVGRTYAAGLERHVELREGQSDRLTVAAEQLTSHGREIDSLA